MFLVLEGLDGSGVGTQAENLRERIMGSGNHVLFLRYPDYNDPLGEMIHEFLHGKFSLDIDTQFLLYSLNILKDMERIRDKLSKNGIIISDRYFTSTLAYQCAKGFSMKKALEFAKLFNFVQPDVVFYLDASVETCIKRKFGEKHSLDIHEKDKTFLKAVSKTYKKLIRDNIFAKKWVMIDAERSRNEIEEEIFRLI